MGCGISKMIIVAVMVADIVAPRAVEFKMPEPTTVVVENYTQYQPQTAIQNSFKYYRVNGVTPPYEWEYYLYGLLLDKGKAWYYPTAVCQIYQESNWNQYSDNGRDKGLCQQKAIYWADRAAATGLPGADIWDVYAQLTVYVSMMSQYLDVSGQNIGAALSLYFLGYAGWSDEYVGHVLRWLDYLEVVE